MYLAIPTIFGFMFPVKKAVTECEALINNATLTVKDLRLRKLAKAVRLHVAQSIASLLWRAKDGGNGNECIIGRQEVSDVLHIASLVPTHVWDNDDAILTLGGPYTVELNVVLELHEVSAWFVVVGEKLVEISPI